MRIIIAIILTFLSYTEVLAGFGRYQTYSTPAQAPPPVSTVFQGDSTKSISSITPSITCLQSGTLQTPAFIQCSASGTTATGSSNPYIDLQYVWTDNNGSPDSFSVPSPIGTRSSSLQYGPEYIQVFRSAGTFTVTLTVSGCTSGHPSTAYTGGGGACNGNAITTASTTQTVTVSAWSGTDYYFNTATGSDSNACTLGSPCLTPNKCGTTLEAGSNRRCNFDCGQTFDGTSGSGIVLNTSASWSHNRIQPGGADCPGASPLISLSSGGNECLKINQNGTSGVKTDFVMSSVNCSNSSTYSSGFMMEINGANTGTGSVSNIFIDNVTITNTLNIAVQPIGIQKNTTGVAGFNGVVLWNTSSISPAADTNPGIGILGGAQLWYAVVGGFVGGGAADPTRDHHIYMHCGGHCVARWVDTGPTCTGGGCTPTRDSCIKTSYDQADGDGTAFTASFFLLTENICIGTSNLGGGGNNTNDPTVSTIDQYIAQQNVISGLSGAFAPATTMNSALRDNWACLTGVLGVGVQGPVGNFFVSTGVDLTLETVLASNIYRNFMYANTSFNSSAHNPLMTYYDESSESYTFAQRVFDNILQSDASNNFMLNIPSTNFVSKSSFVDYNTYYAPNHAGTIMQNADSAISFATWQGLGWDTHGANTNPGFSSPSTCGFGAWPY